MIFWIGPYLVIANRDSIFWQRNAYDADEGKSHDIVFPWAPKWIKRER